MLLVLTLRSRLDALVPGGMNAMDDDDDEDDDDEDEDEEDEDDDDDAPWKYCTKGVGSTVADMSTIFGRLARAVGSS